jgi:hypothetical protein
MQKDQKAKKTIVIESLIKAGPRPCCCFDQLIEHFFSFPIDRLQSTIHHVRHQTTP